MKTDLQSLLSWTELKTNNTFKRRPVATFLHWARLWMMTECIMHHACTQVTNKYVSSKSIYMIIESLRQIIFIEWLPVKKGY